MVTITSADVITLDSGVDRELLFSFFFACLVFNICSRKTSSTPDFPGAGGEDVLGDPGAASRDGTIFSGERLFSVLQINFRPKISHRPD